MSVALSKDDLIINRNRRKIVFRVKYIEHTDPIYCCDSNGVRFVYLYKGERAISVMMCKKHYRLAYHLAKVSGLEPIKVRPYYDLTTCRICWGAGTITSLCDDCIEKITQAIYEADKTQIEPLLKS